MIAPHAAGATPFLILAATAGHVSGLPSLHVGWPDTSVVLRCALVAVSASTAHGLVYLATMRASAATIAPTVYVQILVATLIGIMWFGDWPDAVALGGTALIIAAGVWLWYGGRVGVQAEG
jgi:drug/metabolite transporter (DMT)-like permease